VPDLGLAHRLVVEGLRVDKVPWSANQFAVEIAFQILSDEFGISIRETREETIERRKEEGNRFDNSVLVALRALRLVGIEVPD